MPMTITPSIRLRGIRQAIPSGYVIGRIAPGIGDAQLIPITALTFHQIQSGLTAPGPVVAPGNVVVGWELDGPFSSLASFKGAIVPADVSYPNAIVACYASCDTAPVGNTTIYVVDDLASFLASGAPTGAIAHIDFAAGATTGTVTWYAAPVTVPAYTALYLVTSELFDISLAGVNVLLVGA